MEKKYKEKARMNKKTEAPKRLVPSADFLQRKKKALQKTAAIKNPGGVTKAPRAL
ncbi:MAG: hypothetical protein PHV21_01595 [Synergistaceae bacterium]|nr:hypothetical protein [Synergistaceae bacterium]MDD3915871.1 hypothetical protein [Synergistaceae bacterium]HOO87179.1 hypothetical protein [Synergistales bacterium]HRV97490.1 hypothetical protein [Aminobacteriaceae bacterium]